MGFESFRAELRGGTAPYLELDRAVRRLAHVKPDPDALPTPGSTYYLFDDGRHVIELELSGVPVRLSCRFTLCHPASVDAAFLALVRELMTRFGMSAIVRDDVSPEDSRAFSLDEFASFVDAVSRSIATRRAEWVAAFGDDPLAATTPEVYERIILPRCRPVSPLGVAEVRQ